MAPEYAPSTPAAAYRTVTVPACAEHEGIYERRVRLLWKCPVCGGPRGEVEQGFSYDGSRHLLVNVWKNPCGHVDKYDDVRREADATEREGTA